jgi:tetratricopeptide (TPR) repeat protein
LGRVTGLDVAARTSAFSFRGKNVDVRTIGSTLGVNTVLEGSVQRAGDKLRITAQLVKAADGVTIWSETFDRGAGDIFAVQDEVARAVIAALKGSVLASNARGATATRDPQAYDLYLQGRFFQEKRATNDVRRAIGLFEQAIARDSLFAQAWAGLADAYLVQAFYSNVPTVLTLAAARRALDRALAIDPQLGEAQVTRAYLLYIQDWNFTAADTAFRRALVAVPRYAVAHKWYGDVLHALGRPHEELLRELNVARELDPLSAAVLANFAGDARATGNDTEALRILDQVFALDPSQPHALRTMTALMFDRGDSARFLSAHERFAASSDLAGASAAELRRAWQSGGRDAVARTQIAALERLGLSFEAARWRMYAGDIDGMLRDLDRAVEARSVWIPEVTWLITSDAAKRDPRYRALLERLKIAPNTP